MEGTVTPPAVHTIANGPSRASFPQASMPNADVFLNAPPMGGTGGSQLAASPWASWIAEVPTMPPPPQLTNTSAQTDWNNFVAAFASQAARYINTDTTLLPCPPTNPDPPPQPPKPPLARTGQGAPSVRMSPSVVAQSASHRTETVPIVSPSSESDSHSVFEAAKGLAMVSLEAAAEPHYVGESSGSLWTTVISKGMDAPRSSRATREPSERTSRSPSPARIAQLRTQLARPLSPDLAATVLETVYRHLHSRVSMTVPVK